jgi:hypothetical protein
MTEVGTRRWLPWGTVIAMGALALVLVGVYRGPAGPASPAAWAPTWAAVAAGLAAFLVLRWLQNFLWGLVAGLLVPLHPLFRHAVQAADPGVTAEALALLVLAGVVAGWRLTFLPRFAWRSWLVGAAALTAATGLAWPLKPSAGLVAGALVSVGFLGAAILATRLHRRRAAVLPSWFNIAAAARRR